MTFIYIPHVSQEVDLNSKSVFTGCYNYMIMDPDANPLHSNDQTICICLELMWEAFNVGLEPQLLHHDITYITCVSYEFD